MVPIGIFIAVTAGMLAGMRALAGWWYPGRGRVRRRLAGEYDGGPAAAPKPLYKNLGELDGVADEAGTDEPFRADARHLAARWGQWADDRLRQAGLTATVRQFASFTTSLGLILGGLGLGLAGWLGGAAGTGAGLIGPVVFVSARRSARRVRFQTQLVGAFELMSRVLRAGQSVPEAIRAAVAAFEEPLAGEFGRCLHQIEHGLRPEEAYRELSQRSDILELRIFVVTMTIQRQSGGNLSEVLDRLAAVVRERLRAQQKIRALTAEGRMQSLTLTVLPFLTFGVMYFLNRPYAESLLTQWKLLLVTGGCMAVGVAWIRNIMRFDG